MRVALACVAFAFGALGGAWSGPLIGGTIAYVQGTEAYDIYVVDVGVGRPRRVWREEDDRITSVKLSPDGQRLAFVSGSHGFFMETFIVDVDGAGHTQVTNLPDGESATGAAWSPDSTRLATSSWARRRTDATITMTTRDGADARVLVDAPTARLSSLAWSPRGVDIAYVADGLGFQPGPQLQLVSVSTGETTLLTKKAGFGNVAWSPDGRQLAFMPSAGQNSVDIHVMLAQPDVESRHVATVPLTDGSLVWVDAQHLAFLSETNIRAIHITDLDGKPQAPLNVEATAPIRSFDWVDPARAVRAAGKVATTFGELKAGGGSR